MEPIYDGWTPRIERHCIRCNAEMDTILCLLCDDCHRVDAAENLQADLFRQSLSIDFPASLMTGRKV